MIIRIFLITVCNDEKIMIINDKLKKKKFYTIADFYATFTEFFKT